MLLELELLSTMYIMRDMYNPQICRFGDAITNGLKFYLITHELGVWIVFAARVLLDVEKILGAKSEDIYIRLRARASDAIYDVPVGVDRSSDHPIAHPPLWCGDRRELEIAYAEFSSWVEGVIRLDALVEYRY